MSKLTKDPYSTLARRLTALSIPQRLVPLESELSPIDANILL
jgi:hypothetical protein